MRIRAVVTQAAFPHERVRRAIELYEDPIVQPTAGWRRKRPARILRRIAIRVARACVLRDLQRRATPDLLASHRQHHVIFEPVDMERWHFDSAGDRRIPEKARDDRITAQTIWRSPAWTDRVARLDRRPDCISNRGVLLT